MVLTAPRNLLVIGPLLCVVPAGLTAQSLDLRNAGYGRGDPEAPVWIVEFGDFGCSACATFARNTMPVLDEEYISTGIVYWRYVPFELGRFRNAEHAAAAGECAGEQERFFPMHDRLYAERKAWAASRQPDDLMLAFAAAEGLDRRAFERCYRERRRADRTHHNNALARALGVRVTPTFFVNGWKVQGALPPQAFRQVIEMARGK